MKVKRGAWWLSWDSVSGKISLQSKCYMIRKHYPFLGWLNQNNLPIVLSHLFFFFLAYCTHLYNNGSFFVSRPGVLRAPETSEGKREPLGPCVPSFSKSSLLGAASRHSRRKLVLVLGCLQGLLFWTPWWWGGLAGLTQNQRCTLFSSARGKARCGF